MTSISRLIHFAKSANIRTCSKLFNLNEFGDTQCRQYRGSNRFKKMDAKRKKEKLERELELKYGIKSKPKFNYRKWFLRNYMKELNAFQHRLRIEFNNLGTLISAFSHTSFVDEMESLSADNEILHSSDVDADDDLSLRMNIFKEQSQDISFMKLSVLGCSFLEKTLREAILVKYPNITASLCFQLVKYMSSKESISQLVSNLSMGDLILASKDIEKASSIDGRNFNDEYINSDVFCSLIGAIFIDNGEKAAADFINDFVAPLIDYEDLSSKVKLENPHIILKDILSMHGISGEVKARTIMETGVDTDFPVFYVGIFCSGLKISEGSSYSAATAREDAFKNAVFECLENDVDFSMFKRLRV